MSGLGYFSWTIFCRSCGVSASRKALAYFWKASLYSLSSAYRLATSDAKAAEKMHTESEKLLEEAADKYAGVKTAFDGTVGRKAKSELFDLRHLSVGKAAPEVKGVDQDGRHFKLSDHKGKVVLLDFWSEF